MKFSLVNIQKESWGGFLGITIQNHIGDINTAKQLSEDTHQANGGKIRIGLFPEQQGAIATVQLFTERPYLILEKMA